MKNFKNTKGITLIALVITIIVLIILAGVSISLVMEYNGIAQRARHAATNYTNAAGEEQTKINELMNYVDGESAAILPKINGSISNMINGEMDVTATVTLTPEEGAEIDYANSKFVFTASSEELGIDDDTVYTDGLITEGSNIVKKSKAAGTYYLHVLAVATNGEKQEIISEETATSQGKKNFTYTGSVQNYTLSAGKYKFETWGAQGGSNGGKGGYAAGIITLDDASTALYIYVGGQGAAYTGSDHVYAKGGWPNGGDGYTCTSSYYSGGGGGRSQISIGSADNSKAVLIAGAGASGNIGCSYGYGGGETGGGSYPGTQTSGGTNAGFCYGGKCNHSNGGGDGYFGGGSSGWAAGGGSSLVFTGTHANITLDPKYHLASGENIAGNTNMPNPSGGTETGHTGNGYVRITALD